MATKSFDEKQNEKVIEEFIVSCLMDPAFPKFVDKVETLFTDILNTELNNNNNSNYN